MGLNLFFNHCTPKSAQHSVHLGLIISSLSGASDQLPTMFLVLCYETLYVHVNLLVKFNQELSKLDNMTYR